MMRRSLVALGVVIVVMGVLDAIWLGTMVPAVYRPQMGTLLSDNPVWAAAGAFYLLYAIGLVALVVLPSLGGERPVRDAALRGVLFGLVAYGTYDLTNLATMRDWPVIVTAIDMSWGASLTAVTSLAAAWATRRLAG